MAGPENLVVSLQVRMPWKHHRPIERRIDLLPTDITNKVMAEMKQLPQFRSSDRHWKAQVHHLVEKHLRGYARLLAIGMTAEVVTELGDDGLQTHVPLTPTEIYRNVREGLEP